MVANKDVPKINNLVELSAAYEAERKSSSGRKLFIANMSLVMVSIAIAGSLVFAWNYYQDAINTVQDANSETRQLRVQLQYLQYKVDDLGQQIKLIQSTQQKTQTQIDTIQKQLHGVQN